MTNTESPKFKVDILPPEGEDIYPFLKELSEWMDSKFEIPGTGVRFGLDPLLGLLPGLGDTLSFLVSCYVLTMAAQQGVSRVTMARMWMNIAVDLVVGSVPVLGDLFDVSWKANTRNVELLRRTVKSPLYAKRSATWGDWLFVAGGVSLLFVAMTTIAFFTWTILSGLFGWLTSAAK